LTNVVWFTFEPQAEIACSAWSSENMNRMFGFYAANAEAVREIAISNDGLMVGRVVADAPHCKPTRDAKKIIQTQNHDCHPD